MDKQNSDKFIYNLSTIANIINYLEKDELISLRNIMKKKINISVVCLLQLHEIDKELVVSGSCDSTMKVWKIEKDQCIRTLTGHKSIVKCMIWIKDLNKHFILSGSEDTTLKLWNIDTGKCINTLVGHKGAINSLIYLNEIDKNLVASGSADFNIKLWVISIGDCIKTLEGHTNSINSILYQKTASGSMLLSFGQDETIKVWNINNKDYTSNNAFSNIKTGQINASIAFGSSKVLTCGEDNLVKVWCLIKWDKLKSFGEHKGPIKCIINLEDIDSGLFATGSEDKTIRIWNLKIKDEKIEVTVINVINVKTCFPFSIVQLKLYKEKTLATGNNDGTIQLIKI